MDYEVYIKGTLNLGLLYGRKVISSIGLRGFVDSDYAGDMDKRRSLSGYMFFFHGCLIN